MYVLESEVEAMRLQKQNSGNLYNVAEEIRHLDFSNSERIADIGCGTCALSTEILARNMNNKITAVDLSEIRIQQAKKILNKNQLDQMTFLNANIINGELDHLEFDTVVNRFVLHHLESPKDMLVAMKKVLAPKGRIITIDSDGILFNYFSSNDWVMKKLKFIKEGLKLDMYVGRKLKSYYHQLELKNIDVKMIPMHFFGHDLVSEIEQYKDRFQIMSDFFDSILGPKDSIKFTNEYLRGLEEGEAELFYNKFIVQGYNI